MKIQLPAKTVLYVAVAIAVLLALFPLLWMLSAALKTNGQIIDPNASLIPTDPQWHNLVAAWDAEPFGRFFINTGIFSVAATLGQIFTGMLAGYSFAMYEFPFKRILFYLVLAGLMIPFPVVMIQVVQIIADAHALNTYQGLIIPNLASALGAFLFRQFFLGVPLEIGEAARLDGAGEWRVFRSVYAPLAQPMIASFAIIAFLQNWNNFLFPLLVTNTDSMMLIQQGLTIFQSSANRIEYNVLMAGSLIAILPILVVAMLAQRKIVDGLSRGALQ